MMFSYEKITLSGNKLAEVFLHKTDDKRFNVAIPDIHWSAEFHEIDDLLHKFDHLEKSLNFHLFSGNTEELVKSIIEMVRRYI